MKWLKKLHLSRTKSYYIQYLTTQTVCVKVFHASETKTNKKKKKIIIFCLTLGSTCKASLKRHKGSKRNEKKQKQKKNIKFVYSTFVFSIVWEAWTSTFKATPVRIPFFWKTLQQTNCQKQSGKLRETSSYTVNQTLESLL